MDKYEYRIRAEEINSLIEKKEFAEAVKIADTIDWRRVRSVSMLCKVSELYKINRKYEESKDILLLAYDLQPGSRKIVYSLCELSIKLEETVQAVEYYKEFLQLAPKDSGRFILQYRLYEAQDVSLEERIAVLEEYKKRDYREKWAYELAYLYHRIGLATRCVEECDELILWFGEGKYVLKAMELKMLHAPLSLQQQEKYNARFMKKQVEVVEPVEDQNQTGEEIEPSMSIEIKSVEATRAKTARIPTITFGRKPKNRPDGEITEEDGQQEEDLISQVRKFEQQQLLQKQQEVATDTQEIPTEEVEEMEDTSEVEVVQEALEEDIEVAQDSVEEVENEDTTESEEVAEQEDSEEIASNDDMDIKIKTIDVDDQYSTINLQEVLAKDLAKIFAEEDMEATDATKALPVDSIFQVAASQDGLDSLMAGNVSDTKKIENLEEIKEAEENEIIEDSEKSEEKTDDILQDELDNENDQFEIDSNLEEIKIDSDLEEIKLVENHEEENEKIEEEIEDETIEIEDQPESEIVKEVDFEEKAPEVIVEEVFIEDNDEDFGEEVNEDKALEESVKEVNEEATEESVEEVKEEISEEPVEEVKEEISEEPVEETKKEEGVQSLLFGQNVELPEALLQAVQNACIEAAKQAAAQAAKEATEEAAKQAQEATQAAQEAAQAIKEMQPQLEKINANAISEEENKQTEDVKEKIEEAPEEAVEKQITGQLSIEDIMADLNRENEEKHLEEMKERVSQQTGPLFSGFESFGNQDESQELEMLSPVLNVFSNDSTEEELVQEVEEALKEDEKDNNQSSIDLNSQFMVDDSVSEMKNESSNVVEEVKEDISEAIEEVVKEEVPEVIEEVVKEEVSEITEEKPLSEEELMEAAKRAAVEAAKKMAAAAKEAAQQEANTVVERQLEDEIVESQPDISSTVTFNTAEIKGLEEKLVTSLDSQHYDTSNMQVAALEKEISATLDNADSSENNSEQSSQEQDSEPKEVKTEDKVEEKAETKEVNARPLTKDEKEIFGQIAQTRESQEQIARTIDTISFKPLAGNIIITGEAGTGALEAAKGIVKNLTFTNNSKFSGNVAIYTGEGLTKIDLDKALAGLHNGVLIVNEASTMDSDFTDKLLDRVNALEDTGLLVIFVDEKAKMDQLTSICPKIKDHFTGEINIESLDNNGLVNFGKEYARSQDYSIDEMGVLALYNRIEERQTIDHVVTVEEVKELVDAAILKSEKKNISHFVDVIFAKRYDKENLIVLHEKDFLNE